MSEKDRSKDTDRSLRRINNDTDSSLPTTGLIQSALSNISDEKLEELKEKAAEEAVELEKTRAKNKIAQEDAEESTNRFIDSVRELNESGQDKKIDLTRTTYRSDTETSTSKMHLEVRSGPKCFIATVCFGPNSEEVTHLRNWRDSTLSQSRFGRSFIFWYYRNAPIIANFLENHAIMRSTTRMILRVFVEVVKISNNRSISSVEHGN